MDAEAKKIIYNLIFLNMSLITIFYCVIFKYILIINKYQVHRIGRY